MKRLLSILLFIILIVFSASCGNTEKKVEEDKSKQEEVKKEETEEKKDEKQEEKAEGVPFEGTSGSEMQGTVKLESSWIPFETPAVVEDVFKHNVTKVGNKYYIILDNVLKEFEEKDGKVAYVKDIDLKDKYDQLTKDENGVVYVSSFMNELIGIKNGEQIFKYGDCKSYVSVHSSGKWGILHNGLGKVQKIKFADGTVELKSIENLEGLEELGPVFIGKENIFVVGTVKKNEKNFKLMGVYDFDLKLKHLLGSTEDQIETDTIGHINGATDTKNGYMAFDSNLRKIILWKKDGSLIGEISLSKLLGTKYPWVTNIDIMEDGSILVGLSQERDDKSAKEYLLYTVKGF